MSIIKNIQQNYLEKIKKNNLMLLKSLKDLIKKVNIILDLK